MTEITVGFKPTNEIIRAHPEFDAETCEKLHATWFKAAIRSAFHPESADEIMAKAFEDGQELMANNER